MMTSNTPTQPTEPTHDFEQRCQIVLRQWKQGELSFRDTVERVAGLATEAVHPVDRARAEHLLGYIQHDRGNLNISIYHFDAARSLYEQVGSWHRVAMMDLNLGEAYRYKGDFNHARFLYRKAHEVGQRLDLLDIRTLALANEGLMLISMNRAAQALPILQEAIRLTPQWDADDPNLPGLVTELHYALAVAYRAAEQFDQAWSHARQALATAQGSNQPIQIGIANRAIGDVLTALGSVPHADADQFTDDPDVYYQTALGLLREVHADAELAHTLFAHGTSLARRGRRLRAAHALQQAMIIYPRVEMVADAARAAQAQLDITA